MNREEETRWYAAYTKSRNEKKVYQRLLSQGFEAYLPLQKRLKQWSDRKKWVEEPLLSSYVFVKLAKTDFYNVQSTEGLVRFISFEGKPAPIPPEQIDVLKALLNENIAIEAVDQQLEPGDEVEISFGSLSGLKGELVSHQGKNRLAVKIDHISHRLMVTLPANHVVKAIKK